MPRLLLAEFADEKACTLAVRRMREAGHSEIDVYMPYPSKPIEEALALPKSPLPRYVLAAGLLGAALAYLILWWTQHVDYPLDVGSHPTHSWPAFIAITFETAVLFASLTAFFGALALCRLPKLYHPAFNVEGFERASVDRFFLTLVLEPEAEERERSALAELGPLRVEGVDAPPEGT